MQKKYHYLLLSLALFFIQKSVATTFYINDNTTKGDIYTSAIGNDANDGTSSESPKLTLKAAYDKAKDGDTIFVDTGIYADLSSKGELLFTTTKKIKLVIAGISDTVFSKTPLPGNTKVSPTDIYIENDKPVDRATYLKKIQNGVTNKPQ